MISHRWPLFWVLSFVNALFSASNLLWLWYDPHWGFAATVCVLCYAFFSAGVDVGEQR